MSYISPNTIRAQFAHAMSEMYQTEVPLYGDLLKLVQDINQDYLTTHPDLAQEMTRKRDGLPSEQHRLQAERHGAIRVGTTTELQILRRLFSVMGMFPVSYYDLTVAGIPVHSTAFRAIKHRDLCESPFRIFTSLLRLDLIQDSNLRQEAQTALAKRQIFTSDCLTLIQQSETQGGLTQTQATHFIKEALDTFRWHPEATVTPELYHRLHHTHHLIADIVCFKGPHINHLTPRTLDIDRAQTEMSKRGISAKLTIEGPPYRKNPILLRQTSFKALAEKTCFLSEKGRADISGTHTARFGEIEQRGQALTPKGRTLYDALLSQFLIQQSGAENKVPPQTYSQTLSDIFAQFPDNRQDIYDQELGYFYYHLTELGRQTDQQEITTLPDIKTKRKAFFTALWQAGYIALEPITYEDFLPVSAAGIFRSNLSHHDTQTFSAAPNQAEFEQALGAKVQNEFDLYAQIQTDSQQAILAYYNLIQHT